MYTHARARTHLDTHTHTRTHEDRKSVDDHAQNLTSEAEPAVQARAAALPRKLLRLHSAPTALESLITRLGASRYQERISSLVLTMDDMKELTEQVCARVCAYLLSFRGIREAATDQLRRTYHNTIILDCSAEAASYWPIKVRAVRTEIEVLDGAEQDLDRGF